VSVTVRALQERAARALPAEYVEESGGWWLRHAPDCSWWVGTVLPHGGGATPGELERRVAGAEEFYARRGAVARFQIAPGACPEGLDALLAGRGYRRRSPVSLRVAATEEVLARTSPRTPRVRVDDRPSPEWFEVWHAVNGGGGRSERDLLARVRRPSAYACAMAGPEAVAVGRAVADDGWAGVFGMATLPWARGRGAARGVLAALARWAAAQGARRMYLQVEADNAPALRVYERAGFAERCGYHYRTAS
jgi:RimJ/RimL family protein N-acetyltransferase